MNLRKALQTLQNDTLLSIYQEHYTRLESLFTGRSPETPFGLQGISVSTTDPGIAPEEWFAESIAELAESVPVAIDELVFRPLSICFDPRGVHFIDDLFGAETFLHPFSEQWQVHPFKTTVGTLEYPETRRNPGWLKIRRVAELFLEHDPPNVKLELPTLSSALNIAVNLYGEEILVAMLTDPDSARHDLRIINDVIKELHTWFIDHVPLSRFQPIAMAGRFQPVGHGQICGCTTQLPSNEMYEDFIAPLDAEILSLYPKGGLLHLCGAHIHHIPTWKSMPELKSVQLNDRAALDLPLYFSGLREDQMLYVNYFDDMYIDEVLRITGGERTILVGPFEDGEREALKKG